MTYIFIFPPMLTTFHTPGHPQRPALTCMSLHNKVTSNSKLAQKPLEVSEKINLVFTCSILATVSEKLQKISDLISSSGSLSLSLIFTKGRKVKRQVLGKHGPGTATYPQRSPHQGRLFQECNYHGSKPVPIPGRNPAESALSSPTLCQTKLMFFSMLRREDFITYIVQQHTVRRWGSQYQLCPKGVIAPVSSFPGPPWHFNPEGSESHKPSLRPCLAMLSAWTTLSLPVP